MISRTIKLLRLFGRAAALKCTLGKAYARTPMHVEELEPRVLHSADLAPYLLDTSGGEVQMRVIETPPAQPAQQTEQASRHEVVVVDTATPDYQKLVDDVLAQRTDADHIDVVLIENGADGIEQITDALKDMHDVDAVHIISHGADGAVQLGAATLDSASLKARNAEISGWAKALSDEADVLIYGCDVAATAEGQAFVAQLAQATGADVAASDDVTGNARLGGDWTLEYALGAIQTRGVVSVQAQAAWFATLDSTSLAASQDTTLHGKNGETQKNFGTTTELIVDRETNDLQRALMQFDLSSLGGVTINSAVLKLNATSIAGALNLNVHEVLESWTEGAQNAQPGEANWNDRATGTAWTTAGGTYNATAAATLNTNATGLHSWDITALVQAWVNGSKTNNGLVVLSPDGGGNREVHYGSRESASGPVLVIDYTNTAPVLDATKSPALSTVKEDAGAPSGAVGTLVSSLVDGATPAGQVDNVTDSAGSNYGIAVTGADTTNGSWWYSTNNGTNWNALGAVSASSARLLAADANTRLYFQANANYNGTVANAITFRAWDRVGAANNGGTADTTTVALTVRDNFAAVSYSNNDGTANWSTPWTDDDGGAGSGQIVVTGGRLRFDGGTSGSSTISRDVNLANTTGATLTFDFTNNVDPGSLSLAVSTDAGAHWNTLQSNFASGSGSASYNLSAANTRIRFSVTGDPGVFGIGAGGYFYVDNLQIAYTANLNGGATAFSTATDTANVIVASVNDAPAGANKTVTTNEDQAYVFAAADFGFTDATDNNSLLAVKVSTLPGAGSLKLNGAAVSAGQSVTAVDIAAGRLAFTPAANANGAGYASFTFQVQDDGGTANGGVDLDTVARTMTVNVTAVNDAPSGANNTVTTTEDTAYTFGTAAFGLTDPLESNSLLAVKITTLPTAGSLTLNGAAVTAGQFITAVDIAAGKLWFTPVNNANGNAYSTFTFQVQDNGGTANGGVDLDPVARTMTINVTAVNDAPAGTTITVFSLEDTPNDPFSSDLFGFTDPKDSPDHNFIAVKFTTVATAGVIKYNGVAITAGQVISVADIDSNKLTFTAAANANGAGYSSFTFQVQDDGGTANGGVDFDPTPRTMTIDVVSVNDAPAGTSNTVTTNEDTAYVFNTAAFGFTDPNDAPANSLLNVRIASLPGAGSLTLSGVAVTVGQAITVASINAGNLRYTPAANENGAGYASFTFQVRDNGGTLNGGVNLDPVARTMTINVTAVNDAPVGANKTVTTNEDAAYVFGTAAFGFTDPVDSGAHSLTAVKITSLPTVGSLTLSGAAVTAGQFITAVDIAAGKLVFTPVNNANGNGYSTFTFQVQDTGGTANGGVDVDTVARTMTIDVTSVNDAPSGTGNTVTTLEDSAYVFAAAAFGYGDALDSNGLLAVKISSLPGLGSLTLDGAAVGAGQFVSAVDIAAGKLVFTPASNANGAGYASFTFQVQDDGGTANGGANLDPVARTMTIDVTPVNDAPAGTSRTVTTNEDTAFVFTAAAFGYTDAVDAHALSAVQIGTVSGAGSLTLNGVTVSNGQSVSAADIAAGLLVFTPAANANGAGYASFTFQVQDGGGTANGGADLDPVARTMTIDVASVNDAPAGADNTVTTNEDVPFVFTAAAFGYTDAIDANSLVAVKIDTLPGAGSLRLNGVAVTAAQVVSAADIAAGKLVYTPGANANGAGYASFTFRVQDNGGTANGGVDLDALARTMTIDVTAVNDAPVGSHNTVTMNEDATYVFGAAAFGLTDASDAPANNFAAVKISSLPGAGSLTLNGVAVTAGQVVSAADIAAGKLVFAPAANGNGAGYAAFTFQVQDDGGTANGGADLDAVARTMTIDVVSVNDAPAAVDTSVGTPENQPFVFTIGAFGFADPADDPDNSLLAVRIETLPVVGDLTLNGVAVTAGQSVSAADIAAGKLVYTALPNTNGTNYASFTFRVQDDGGTANGGADTDALARVLNIDVGPINHAPLGSNATVVLSEDSAFVFDVATFGFSDANDTTPNNLLAVKITALPVPGALTLNGVDVVAGQFVSAVDIAAGKLVYRPPPDANGANYANLRFQVQDDGGTANNGVDLDPTTNRIRFDVTGINDAPAGTATTVTTNEDTPYVFAAGAFGLTDAADSDSLLAVKIASLPVAGALRLDGVAVTAGQFVAAADIAAGKLVFTPAANANGAGYASFTFQVQDSGGTASNGIDLDPVARTLTVDVRAVNDAPAGTSTTVTTDEDTPLVFTAAAFGYTDAVESNSLLGVKVTSVPGAGALTLNGVAVVAGQVVAAADIAAGKLVFTPVANANGGAYASFTFQVQDDGGTANGGVDLDATARTLTIDVTPVNDAPAGTSTTVTTREDTPYVFWGATFGLTDAADSGMNLLAVKVTTLPAAGSLTLDGVTVTAGQFVSAADISAGKLAFAPAANANGAGYASFTFQVQDSGGTAHGGVDLDPVARTMTIDVTPVNDAPAGTSNTVTTNEDTPFVFDAAAFGFSDAADGHALMAVKITTLPVAGSLTLNGAAVAAGQSVSAALIAAGKLVYTPVANANGAGYASFTFQVEDSGGTANGGVDLDGTARTMTIDVASVNDAPGGANRTVTTNEDTPLVLQPSVFGFADAADSNAFLAVKISALPAAGSLTLDGVAVTAGQFLSRADIAAGKLLFAPAANANGGAYASFTFQVQDDGGTARGGVDLDATARTLTIDVVSVNDAPTGTNNTVTTNEDTPFVFTAAAFGYADADSNSFLTVRISTLPTAGSLMLDGAMVSAGDLVSVADIAAGSLVFTPAANANGAAYASFTFQVQDDGGVANGGADLDVIARTMTIDVIAVNDAPVGDNATVTIAEDTPYVFDAASFGFTDPADVTPNALAAVKITTVPGAGWLALDGVTVTAGQSVSVADIVAGKLVFAPAANANGGAYASFTFQVQDDGNVTNGGVNLDVVARTMTIDVTSVNDAPAGTSTTLTTNEDTPLVLTAGAFGFGDAADSNMLLALKLASLPGAGALTLDGATVTAGQFVSLADIAAGKLVFAPAANANGAGYASFTFQVQDDGGVANGGADLDATPRTMTIDVVAINDAPAGTDATVSTNEDTPLVFTAAQFGFGDAADSNAPFAVTITTLPGAGALTLDGVALAAGQSVSAADIAAGKLVFAPAANANGAAYAGFTFQVRDDGGTSNGGVDLDPVARTMTIDVLAVNDPPAGANVTVTTSEDTPYVFDAAVFGFTDAADAAPNALAAVRITTVPGAGALTLDGIAVSAGQSVGVADIVAGRLVFSPAADANGAAYASFTFQVQDDGGGSDLDVIARTLTIDVTSVNDAPAGATKTVAAREDTAFVFAASDFGYRDTADAPSDTFLAVKIAALPTAGSLTLNGVAVSAGQFVALADISAGKLVYTPVTNANGAAAATFGFQVQDDGGTANGGSDLDGVMRRMRIDIASVNDAPTGANATVATNEDTPVVFTTAQFGFRDTADSNGFLAVKITTLPGAGSLTLNGSAVSAGQFVSRADIAAGKLLFTPAANANGAAYAKFTFQVQDDGGTARGGVDLDVIARTMTIDVASVNDAPSGTSATIATNEDTPIVFDASVFGYSDAADGDGLRAVKITTVPGAGALTLNGVAVTAGQVVSLADLAAGNLVFRPDADVYGAAYASFTFQVQDDGGTARGGVNMDATARALTIDVASVNDAPTGTLNTVTTLEDTALAFRADDFGFSDAQDPAANRLAAVKITSTPTAGTLMLKGAAVTAGQYVSVEDISAGRLVFKPAADANGAGYASFTFQVQDDGGTARGGVSVDTVARKMTINVTPVEDYVPELPPIPVMVAQVAAPVVSSPAASAPAASTASTASSTSSSSSSSSSSASTSADKTSSTSDSGSKDSSSTATGGTSGESGGGSGGGSGGTGGAAGGATGPSGGAPVGASVDGLGVTNGVATGGAQGPGGVQRLDAAGQAVNLKNPVMLAVLSDGGLSPMQNGLGGLSLGLASPQAQALASAPTSAAAVEHREVVNQLDEMRESLREQSSLEASTVAASAAASLGLSVGYVVWLLRGGVLLSTVLYSLPAWRSLDPLPILERTGADGDSDDDDDDGDDSLESLVARNNNAAEPVKPAPAPTDEKEAAAT